jgi:L-amino acid N-acyltransferase YncA
MAVIQPADGWNPFEYELLIRDIAVLKTMRLHGVGSQLVEAVTEAARNMGIGAIVSEIYDWNDASKALHRQADFRPVIERWYRFL